VIIFWERHGYGVIASLSQWVTRVAAMGDIKKLCIIGAGFAGLTAARVFKALNYDITLYEKDAQVGGVWAASRHRGATGCSG
jgi:cation diffusion facilitator CzcD-associated flavoprotein CzcO